LTAGVNGCYLIDMEIIYKYDPRQAILLDPKGHSIDVRYRKFAEMRTNPIAGHYKFHGID
jgi:hypothetical protein